MGLVGVAVAFEVGDDDTEGAAFGGDLEEIAETARVEGAHRDAVIVADLT